MTAIVVCVKYGRGGGQPREGGAIMAGPEAGKPAAACGIGGVTDPARTRHLLIETLARTTS